MSDGLTLREMRLAALQGQDRVYAAWRARLAPNKQLVADRLDSWDKTVVEALDRLVPFVGLWPAFGPSHICRMMKMHCEKVCVEPSGPPKPYDRGLTCGM